MFGSVRRSSVPGIDALTPKTHARRADKVVRHRLAHPATVAVVAVMALVATSCGSSSHHGTTTTLAPTTTARPTTSTSRPTTSTTAAVTQAHGSVTVLSPIGLHVRAGPSRSAKVIGSAAWGAVLQLIGYTSRHGGWYKVQGTTLTGWMSADPAYSARGQFSSYNGTAFSVLYPAGWTQGGVPKSGVTFRSPSPSEKVIITTAPSLAKLPPAGHGVGVSQSSSRVFVACGVTSYFVTYTTSAPNRDLAGIALLLDAHHALGLRATYTSPSQLRTVLDFVNSLSFPFAVCIGGPHPTDPGRPRQGFAPIDGGPPQGRAQEKNDHGLAAGRRGTAPAGRRGTGPRWSAGAPPARWRRPRPTEPASSP